MAENTKIGNSDKSETAVEWLVEQLYSHSGHIDVLDVAHLNGYFEQAEQMEKEKITKAFYDGMSCGEFDGNMGRAEQYYKETYGTNEI